MEDQSIYLESVAPDAASQAGASESDRQKTNAVQSWSKWLLGFGILNIVMSGFSSGFGVLLIIVGLVARSVHAAAMLVVISVILLWAAASNLMAVFLGDFGAAFWGILQLVLVFQTFKQYLGLRGQEREASAETALPANYGPDRIAQIFPAGGCLLTIVAAVGATSVFFLIGFMISLTGIEEPPAMLPFAFSVLVNLGVLGAALGLASLLSGYRFRLLAALSVMAGSLIVAADFYLVLSA